MNPESPEIETPPRPQAGGRPGDAGPPPRPATTPLDDLKGALPYAQDLFETLEERMRLEIERMKVKGARKKRALATGAVAGLFGAGLCVTAAAFLVIGLVQLLALVVPVPGLAAVLVGGLIAAAAFIGLKIVHKRQDRADLARLREKFDRHETHEDRKVKRREKREEEREEASP